MQLTEAKTQDAKDNIDEIRHVQAMIPVKVARPFVPMLRRALTDHTQWTPNSNATRKRLEKLVFVKHIAHAFTWLRPLLSRAGPLRRTFTFCVRSGSQRCQFHTDASPNGFGRMIIRHHCRPEAYWADSLSDDELCRFRSVNGHPSWQAEWELLAILISLHVSHSRLVESERRLSCSLTVQPLCL